MRRIILQGRETHVRQHLTYECVDLLIAGEELSPQLRFQARDILWDLQNFADGYSKGKIKIKRKVGRQIYKPLRALEPGEYSPTNADRIADGEYWLSECG